MKLERKDNGSYRFTLDDTGNVILLTANQMSFLFNQYAKISLHDSIEYECKVLDQDIIDLGKCPDGFDSFVDEIMASLEDEVDYGNLPDDDDIQERIIDFAKDYNMWTD